MDHSTRNIPFSKVCRKCEIEKPSSEFRLENRNKDGLYSYCNDCERARSRESRQRHRDKRIEGQRQYYRENREDVRAKAREYYQTHKKGEVNRLEGRRWREKNRERTVQYAREYRAKRPGYAAEISKAYQKRYPERQRARYVVHDAVKTGKFPPAWTMVCEHCQEALAAHWHHHNGYAIEHKLDVIAVCTECHGREHRVDDV